VLSDNFRVDFRQGLGEETVERINDFILSKLNRRQYARGTNLAFDTLVTNGTSLDENYHLIRKQMKKIKNEGLLRMANAFIVHLLEDPNAQVYFSATFRWMESCAEDTKGCIGVTLGRHLMDLYTILRMLKTHDIDEGEKTKYIYITNGSAHVTDMHQYFAIFLSENYGGTFLTDRVSHTTMNYSKDLKCVTTLANIEIPLKRTQKPRS
jgi:hypothetical protein